MTPFPSHSKKIIKQMTAQLVKHTLKALHLNLHPLTISQTLAFMDQHIGFICAPSGIIYHILASAAIVSEGQMVPSVLTGLYTHTGVRIENIMRHLHDLDVTLKKEVFLDVLTSQTEKFKETPNELKIKIDTVRMNFRIYNKFRNTFSALMYQSSLDPELQSILAATMWILYLFLKNRRQLDESIDVLTILLGIFETFFSQLIAHVSRAEIYVVVKKAFPKAHIPKKDVYVSIRDQLIQQLQQIHTIRFGCHKMQMDTLMKPEYAYRLLDDISNEYDVFKETLPDSVVDQISFLELVKDMAPLPFSKKETVIEFLKPLDFDSGDEDVTAEKTKQEGSLSTQELEIDNSLEAQSSCPLEAGLDRAISSSVLQNIQTIETLLINQTPLTSQLQNLIWVREQANRVSKTEELSFRKIYKSMLNSEEFSSFQKWANQKISHTVRQFLSYDRDVEKRTSEIYRLCKSLTIVLQKSKLQVRAVLCLATALFVYANHPVHISYKSYCEIFGISLLEGYQPIPHVTRNAFLGLPKNMKQYLYALEKKIVIEELWDDETGFLLLADQQTESTIPLKSSEANQSDSLCSSPKEFLTERIYKHVIDRTNKLCEKLELKEIQSSKIVQLMKCILSKRYHLLRDRKLDQIIVCSIASSLSINNSSNKLSLEEIFEAYNTLTYSQYSNQEDLLEFYNKVFLSVMEDILQSSDATRDLLGTPVRNERKRQRDEGKNSTPATEKYKQLGREGGPTQNSKQKMYKRMSKIKESEEDQEQQEKEHQGYQEQRKE